jgi:hypothetical protein
MTKQVNLKLLKIVLMISGLSGCLVCNTLFAAAPVDEGIVETTEVTETTTTDANPKLSNSFKSTEIVQEVEDVAQVYSAPYSFIFDQYSSMYVGAYALTSALHAYQSLDDYFIPNTHGATDWTMFVARFGKLVLEDVLFSWGMVAQHEIFGHGARAREFHLHIRGYRVTPWSGFTAYRNANFNRLSPSEKIAFTTGGMEGTYILAKHIRTGWLQNQCMDERSSHFYLITAFDQTRYVMSTRDRHRRHGLWVDDSHDVNRYIFEVNRWYGRQVLSGHKLRHQILFDYLDPYLFYSIYALGAYLFEGAQKFEYPMLQIGDYGYLPGFRIGLAPYGPEYQFINYIRSDEQTIQVTFRYGHLARKYSYGFILDIDRLISSDLLNIGTRLDLWNQPRIHAPSAMLARNKYGAALSLMARYKMNNCFELIGQLGYKTTGYIPGEVLKHSPIVRAGFALHL